VSDTKQSSGTTLVEEGTEFEGSLSSDRPIEVRGRVFGDLTAPSLQISLTGAVRGKVKVGELRSQGEIAGDVDADVVEVSGVVKDNTVLRARSLELKLAPADGKVQITFGESPSRDRRDADRIAGAPEKSAPLTGKAAKAAAKLAAAKVG
jgi:cytoskeletal protein CcmA (bactofilin family)